MKKLVEIYEASQLEEAANVEEFQKEISRFLPALKKKGIEFNPQDWIGSGTQGVAFLTGDNKVLKITQDKSEALASAALKGKKTKKIVYIFDVFQLQNTSLFGILQEKLEDANINYAVDEYLAIFGVHISEGMNPMDALQDADYAMKQQENPDRAEKFEKVLEFAYEATLELKKLGIQYRDFHTGNIMQRGDGEYVLIDLGYSISPNKAIPTLKAENKGVKIWKLSCH